MTAVGQSSLFVDRRISGRKAPKAATPTLPGPGGIKPALLFGKPIDQPIEEQPHLGA